MSPGRKRTVVIRPGSVGEESYRLEGEPLHYVRHVLRLEPGAPLELVDGTGAWFEGELERYEPRAAVVAIRRRHAPADPPRPRLTLIYGLSRRVRTEWVLQKATELGADRILLGTCRRSVARPRLTDSRLARWEEIVEQAMRQSGRKQPPAVSPPRPLAACLRDPPAAAARLITVPGGLPPSRLEPLLASHPDPEEVAVAVGPEGGFADEEIADARGLGYEAVSLGPRTLRTETAALTALALVAFASGRLEG